jgi:hypothetical protein
MCQDAGATCESNPDHDAHDSLTTRMHMNVLDRDLLLALSAVAIERLQQ